MAKHSVVLTLITVALAILGCVSLSVAPSGSTSLIPGLQPLISAFREFWDIVGPGGKLHPAYFLEHKGHLVVEALLVVVIAYLFLQHSFKPHPRSEDPLTEKDIQNLCREWEPEPLVPKLKEHEEGFKTKVLTGASGIHATVDGRTVLNLASANMLCLGGTADMTETARDTIEKYGVGSCGPRGFYGTIDVHLQLEDQLAQFMGTDECIIYSFDIATVASIVPAFASRKDIIIADECCSFPIQQGIELSRASVHYFKHNDVADLERILISVDESERKQKKPLNRRLIIVEGIYATRGDMAPLDKIYEIKEKYKYRLLVEESFSFGVLGRTGRGACEHFGLKPKQIEVLCATMGGTLGSVGGFCVGDNETIEHQRLSGSGYCFSASLPPYLATSASHALAQLKGRASSLLPKLHQNATALRRELRKIPGLVVSPSGAADMSPLIFLQLAKPPVSPPKECHKAWDPAAAKVLQRIADVALEKHNVLLAVPRFSYLDRAPCAASIRLFVSAAMSDKDIAQVVKAVREGVKEVLGL